MKYPTPKVTSPGRHLSIRSPQLLNPSANPLVQKGLYFPGRGVSKFKAGMGLAARFSPNLLSGRTWSTDLRQTSLCNMDPLSPNKLIWTRCRHQDHCSSFGTNFHPHVVAFCLGAGQVLNCHGHFPVQEFKSQFGNVCVSPDMFEHHTWFHVWFHDEFHNQLLWMQPY